MSQGGILSTGGGPGEVFSVTGTANQVLVSPTTGNVVVSLTNGVSLGSYQAITPPTGGLLIPGQVSVGTSSFGSTSLINFSASASFPFTLSISGTKTSTNLGLSQGGIIDSSAYNPTGGVSNASSVFSSPSFVSPSAQTIALATCFFARPTLSGNIGTITNVCGFYSPAFTGGSGTISSAYGAYFTAPGPGLTSMALYADNATIGSPAVNPPASGLYVTGNIRNAALSINSLVATDGTKDLVSKNISVNQQAFLSPGTFTYTPTAGTIYAFVQVLGGGGGGGGVTNSSSVDVIAGSGGGGGGYTEAVLSAATIGASQTVTVGAGGVGVITEDGTDGSASSFGALLIGNGGNGGVLGIAETGFIAGGSGGGYTGTSLVYGYAGQTGGISGPPSGTLITDAPPYCYAGYGGSCFTGRQNQGYAWSTLIGPVAQPGTNETEYGVAGSGALSSFGSADAAGGNGMSGFVIVTEYILS